MRDRLRITATIGITALSAGLVVVAMVLTGGPVQARKEYRDNIRLQDLRAIRQHVACTVADRAGPLPEVLEPVSGCGMVPRLRDPYTDVAYRYEVLDHRTLRLCAGFEVSADPHQQTGDETIGPDPDCRDFRIWRSDGAVEGQDQTGD